MIDRATTLIEQCEGAAHYWRRSVVSDAERRGRKINPESAIFVAEPGPSDVDASYDIARTLIEGKQLNVWVNANDIIPVPPSGGHLRSKPTLDWLKQLPMLDTKGYISPRGLDIIDAARLFDRLHLPGPNPKLNIVLDDIEQPTEETEIRAFLLDRMLSQFGLTSARANMEVGIIRTSAYQSNLEAVIDDLANAGNGRLRRHNNGEIRFEFSPWMSRWFDLQYRSETGGRTIPNILIKNKAGYGDTVKRMLPFLDQRYDAAMHVQLGIERGVEQGLEVALRAGEYHRPDNTLAFTGAHMHTFTFGNRVISGVSSDVYSMATLLSTQAKNFRHSLRASSFDRLQPEGEGGYLTINYTEKLPQDRIIIRSQMRAEARLALRQQVDPNDETTLYRRGDVMHICVGTNPYAVMMSGVYSEKGEGTVLGWDIAPQVVEYNGKVKGDPSYDFERRRMWQEEIIAAAEELKDEPEFRELGLTPDHFRTIDRTARQQVNVEQQGIADLPPNTFKRIYMHFGVEATARSRVEYHGKMRTVAESMRGDEARLIMVLTEKSDPLYPGGKNKKFTAYSTEMRGFELAMLDCGLTIEHLERIDEQLPEEEKLRQGENFILIVAKLRPEAIRYDS
jgi:hypothetical protein